MWSQFYEIRSQKRANRSQLLKSGAKESISLLNNTIAQRTFLNCWIHREVQQIDRMFLENCFESNACYCRMMEFIGILHNWRRGGDREKSVLNNFR
jgi:hypothetical protein